jgi:hypothetical protein
MFPRNYSTEIDLNRNNKDAFREAKDAFSELPCGPTRLHPKQHQIARGGNCSLSAPQRLRAINLFALFANFAPSR